MESLKALFGRIGKSSAKGIVDAQRLNLSSVGLLIDYNRWIDRSSILSPVLDFSVNFFIVVRTCLPITSSKTLLDAGLCFLKVDIKPFVSISRTRLIDHAVTGSVNLMNVLPP